MLTGADVQISDIRCLVVRLLVADLAAGDGPARLLPHVGVRRSPTTSDSCAPTLHLPATFARVLHSTSRPGAIYVTRLLGQRSTGCRHGRHRRAQLDGDADQNEEQDSIPGHACHHKQ